ncbi:MAG: pyridoxamine 5'-phosphate oxidase family protein, partial [Gaiellaceae bacterium]
MSAVGASQRPQECTGDRGARPRGDRRAPALPVVGRIGCHADGLTYVVPVIYAYDGEGFYAYSLEGRKIRMMRSNPRVCFEVDEYDGRGSWRSAIVQGTYEELEGAAAERALALLSERFAERAATSDGEQRRRG